MKCAYLIRPYRSTIGEFVVVKLGGFMSFDTIVGYGRSIDDCVRLIQIQPGCYYDRNGKRCP